MPGYQNPKIGSIGKLGDVYPFSDGGRQALLLAWGFGRGAPEASVGMSRDPEKALRLRYQRREALAPAPSAKKPALYDSKRTARAPRPGHLLVFTPDLNPLRLPTRD